MLADTDRDGTYDPDEITVLKMIAGVGDIGNGNIRICTEFAIYTDPNVVNGFDSACGDAIMCHLDSGDWISGISTSHKT
jgi:hypothetical protein